jgi:hypothetical protein
METTIKLIIFIINQMFDNQVFKKQNKVQYLFFFSLILIIELKNKRSFIVIIVIIYDKCFNTIINLCKF